MKGRNITSIQETNAENPVFSNEEQMRRTEDELLSRARRKKRMSMVTMVFAVVLGTREILTHLEKRFIHDPSSKTKRQESNVTDLQ